MIGMAKAKVLPLPVKALPTKSLNGYIFLLRLDLI